VKIWFQNRRTKWKKQDGISNAEAAELKIGEKSTKSKCSAAKAGAPLAADALAKGPASGAGGASPLLPASSNSSSALTVNQQSFSGSAKPSPCGVSDLSNLSSSGDRTDDSSQHYPPSSDPEKFENGALAANHDGANGAGVALACRDSPSLADERPFRDAVDQVPIQRVPKQGTDAAFVLVAASPVLSCDAADKFQDSSQVEHPEHGNAPFAPDTSGGPALAALAIGTCQLLVREPPPRRVSGLSRAQAAHHGAMSSAVLSPSAPWTKGTAEAKNNRHSASLGRWRARTRGPCDHLLDQPASPSRWREHADLENVDGFHRTFENRNRVSNGAFGNPPHYGDRS
ncbi:unnamed protein product, partial [Ixodes persulcatus]